MACIPSIKSVRRASQWLFAAACLYTGWRFALFLDWAAGLRPEMAARPAGIEAFLPIAALAGFKNLLLGGGYDPVHPAGLTVFLAALASALFFRKSFCAAVCPVGLASDLLGAAGMRLGLARSAPFLADKAAGVLKYLLLAFFLVSIFVLMDPASTRSFLTSAYNLTADAHLFLAFARPSGTFLGALGFLALAGLVFRNAWCRWLCPYGALLGLLGLAGPCRVRRDAPSCDGCGRCRRVCPMDIAPGSASRSPQCMACGQCLTACPKPETLTLRYAGKRIPSVAPVLAGAGLFLLLCLLAMALGAWDNGLPPQMLRRLYASSLG